MLFVLVSGVSFGFTPIFARLAYSQGIGVDELLFLRFLFAFLMMGAILAACRRLVVPKRSDLAALIVLGAVAYFVEASLYFYSLLYTSVALATLLLYTYPVFVMVGAFLLGWEKISRVLRGAIIISLIGLLLVANPFNNSIGVGVVLALGASVMYTAYILGGSKVLRKVDGDIAAFYVMGSASVSYGLAGAFTGSIRLNWSFQGWVWTIMIALVCTVIAVTTFFMGISRIGASRSALISLVEPVTSILLALLLFGNALTATQWFGGLLILAATSITALYSNR